MSVNHHRRQALVAIAGRAAVLGLAVWSPTLFASRNQNAFRAKTVPQAIFTLLGAKPVASEHVIMRITKKAKRGEAVPVVVSSPLPGVNQISIFIDDNPFALAAHFELSHASIPEVTTRIRLDKTCRVTAVISTNGKHFRATQLVEVGHSGYR